MLRLWCWFRGHDIHVFTDDWGLPYTICRRCNKFVHVPEVEAAVRAALGKSEVQK